MASRPALVLTYVFGYQVSSFTGSEFGTTYELWNIIKHLVFLLAHNLGSPFFPFLNFFLYKFLYADDNSHIMV